MAKIVVIFVFISLMEYVLKVQNANIIIVSQLLKMMLVVMNYLIVFGRQRHNKHRDDMSGVGSFLTPCRTIFVGGILKHKYDSPQQIEESVWKHFGEWGEVENVNFVQRLAVAFVRYRVRTSAGGHSHPFPAAFLFFPVLNHL